VWVLTLMEGNSVAVLPDDSVEVEEVEAEDAAVVVEEAGWVALLTAAT
jgi:hypothetical protein